ncbi:MAG: hypothetical protein KKF85_17115 [Gammaproteobacteria bacterium]|nr:hypothetical protein [Rhodocyclaceae bacterium]MBU3910916.1 hypothetical protein [Gammaproteobacteria bacterium]MBU3988138.1 hypothetical protein [Gammaproteobacteria bacterium]MBU4006370.1 hypothetical protein [Gammaproteobacteria bacterium]MBU4097977.1 hypothetical protein [Gammaproteobacteria bacterium]
MLLLSNSACAGVERFFQEVRPDLPAAAQARGFPVTVRILATDRETALRYAGRDDGEESLAADCRQEVPGDDGSNDMSPERLPKDSIRCAALTVALFRDGAMSLITFNEAVISPFGMGARWWQEMTDAMRRRVGDELALALVAGHEMAHIAWQQGVSKTAHARGCGADCDPALFYESDLVEAYCDFLAVWIVAVRHERQPQELKEALAAGRATLNAHFSNEWAALARLLADAQLPSYSQMDFSEASATALKWAMRMPGLRERWTIPE